MGLSIFQGPIAKKMADALDTMANNQSSGIGAAETKATAAQAAAEAASAKANQLETTINNLTATNVGAVSYTTDQSDTLTESQKMIARTNIGLANIDALTSGNVKYDQAQTLGDGAKLQARQNIGAASTADITNVNTAISGINEDIEAQGTQISGLNTRVGTVETTLSNVNDLVSGVVKYSEQQRLLDAEKEQARNNINAASKEVESRVSSLESSVNTLPSVTVTAVTKNDSALNISYSDNTTSSITINSGGMDFDGGKVVKETDTETGKDKYMLYLTKQDQVLPANKFTPFEIPATGTGGGASSVITLSNVVRPTRIRNGGAAEFEFVATASDDQDITVKWSVNGTQVASEEKISGSKFTFTATSYLESSTVNVVRAEITTTSGGSLSRNYEVTTYAYALEWDQSIDPIVMRTSSASVFAVVKVSAEANTENTVTISVNGHSSSVNVVGSRNATVELLPSWFNTGSNTVTASMHPRNDENDRAEDITFVVLWCVGATAPIVTFAESAINGVQYDVIDINYFVYDPDNEIAECTLQIGEEEPTHVSAERTSKTYQYAPMTDLTTTITLTCGTSHVTIPVKIKKSTKEIGKITGANLRYDLDPTGHSNAELNKESFAGLSFSANFDWVNGGFQRDAKGANAFVVKKGNTVTLPRSLFADTDQAGKTIDVSFKVVNSDAYDAVAMSDLNIGGTKGLILKANEGEIRMNNSTGKVFRYCEENRIDLSILVETTGNQRLATIWMDGIPSKVEKYTADDLVQDEKAMTIGSAECDVWIYAIRVYNTALNRKEMIQNYIASGSTTEEKLERYRINDIYDPDANDKITPKTLKKAMPNLTIIEIEAPRMTKTKNDPVRAHVKITDGDNVLDLPAATTISSDGKKADGCIFKVQGTSSVAYARSALNMDIDFQCKLLEGDANPGYTYKISENAVPVSYLNIKVNVASSENANNVCAVDWYNTYQPFKIYARQQNSAIRDTVEGKPCAVFFTNTSEEPVWVSSQRVAAGETILYVMGDLCNSKKNTKVFGQDNKGEHLTKCCIECSGNDTDEQRFRKAIVYNSENGAWDTISRDAQGNIIYDEKGKVTYTTHFEWRMEPSSANETLCIQAWTDTVAWVISTIDNPTKFKEEFDQYFIQDPMLYHFLMIEYFAAYDNVSKNTFYSFDWDPNADQTKWDGYRWSINKAYDWDTILAHDNDGKPLGDYGIDFGEWGNGKSYFNAATNPIWVNIQSAYQSELSTMYIRLRSEGAWNANAIAAKWDTYQARRPHAAMVEDMYNKYILPYKTTGVVLDTEELLYDDDYLARMAGSKTYQRRQYLTYQTNYMDGKYGYYDQNSAIKFRVNGAETTKNFNVKSYAKTYLKFIKDGQLISSLKVGTGEMITFENITVGNDTTMYVAPEGLIQYIRPLNETLNRTFGAGGAKKLTEVILGGDMENTVWDPGTALSVPSPILKDLSIRNITNFTSNMDLSQNTELTTIDTRGTQVGSMILPNYAPLTSIQLNGCTDLRAMNLNAVSTFTMETGENLTSVRAENCNHTLMRNLSNYLTQATASTSSATRRIRVINAGWHDAEDQSVPYKGMTFTDLTALYKIAKEWKGFNANGENQDKPVVTGEIFVTNLSLKKLETIHAVWGSGTMEDALDQEGKSWTGTSLTIHYENIVPYYEVSFVNVDGSPILVSQNPYIQYVDYGDEAYDPVGLDIEVPTYIDPLGKYTYTYTGWANLTGRVYENKTVTAQYSTETIKYTVKWYIKPNEAPVYELPAPIEYGSEAVYPYDPPVLTDEEPTRYKVFSGWDKSTGYVTSNMDVYAQWTVAAKPAATVELQDMNPAQIYSITKTNSVSSYWTDGDYTDIQVGHDYNFSNVESEVLATNLTLDGSTNLPTSVKPFAADASSFTLAIDFEYGTTTNNATMLSFDTGDISLNSNAGFQIRQTSNVPNITSWRSDAYPLGTNSGSSVPCGRGIVVIRHIKGENKLYVSSSNMSDNVYNTNTISNFVLTRSTDFITNATLTLGGVTGSDVKARGIIYWCKIWYADLGPTVAADIASWPRETWRMQYVGAGRHYVYGTDTPCSATFLANSLLAQKYPMYLAPSTAKYGWANSDMRTFVNTRCLKALPIEWQVLLKSVRVDSTSGRAANNNALTQTSDKIYLPSFASVVPSSNQNLTQEEISDLATISIMGTITNRPKFCGVVTTGYVYMGSTSATEDPVRTQDRTFTTGDVWYQGQDNGKCYVYYTKEDAAKHGKLAGQNKTIGELVLESYVNTNGNEVLVGYWAIAHRYWTRTAEAKSTAETPAFYYVHYYPSTTETSGESNLLYGVDLMFSI